MNSRTTNSSVCKKQKPPSKNLKAFLMFLSDVLGVEVFLLAPTASGGDGPGPRFCAPLSPSTLSSFPPRFLGIARKTLEEFCFEQTLEDKQVVQLRLYVRLLLHTSEK
jgi:hypothetical protein